MLASAKLVQIATMFGQSMHRPALAVTRWSEFTNGKKSGWMYTVNGTHPNQGLKNWELKDKDVVVWH